MNIDLKNIRFTGTQINYYFLCRKKLWYFTKNIEMEQNSDAVYLGKLIHETSYDRENKEIDIDDTIKIDFIGKDRVIHEVKKSDKVEEPHIWQLKYYLWYLKQKGVDGVTGKINYPKLRKTLDVFLEPGDDEKIRAVLSEIKRTIDMELPPASTENKDVQEVQLWGYVLGVKHNSSSRLSGLSGLNRSNRYDFAA